MMQNKREKEIEKKKNTFLFRHIICILTFRVLCELK